MGRKIVSIRYDAAVQNSHNASEVHNSRD